MRMSDFVVREAIIPDLTANTKEGVIREMVESLRAAGYFKGSEPEDIVKAILKRELLGSTGIGRGVAIPHTKHNSVDRLVGTVALSHARRALRQPRRRAGARVRPADFAAGPARRPLACPGERVAQLARRRLRPLAPQAHHAAKPSGSCWTSDQLQWSGIRPH